MNKLLLLGAVSILSVSATAQTGSKVSTAPKNVQKNIARAISTSAASLSRNATPATPVTTGSNKGTAGTMSRWYVAPEALANYAGVPIADIYGSALATFKPMWQDSSVRYVDPSLTDSISASGIAYQSIAQTFHPQSSLYNDLNTPQNVGQQEIKAGDSYTIDSIRIRGSYSRIAGTTTVDTLIFATVTETATKKFSNFSFGAGVNTNHGIDTFSFIAWDSSDYQVAPITQISYGSQTGGFLNTPVIYKLPMTATTFADSNLDGTHTLTVPAGISVVAGAKAAVSITFKSGAPYTPGTRIDKYNFFSFLSHETLAGGYIVYPVGDKNMSSVVLSDTTNATVGNGLNYYYPTIGFTAPFDAEAHNISFLASCTTCSPVSVKNTEAAVEEVVARPNPANNELFVPVTLKSTAADVAVTLTNPMGQLVAKQNLGKVAAGQTATATFNTAALSSGVYFYTVEAAGTRTTNRVVVAH